MSNPLHAKFYADQATQLCVEVVENVPMARDTFRVRFRCRPRMRRPGRSARRNTALPS